MTEVECPASTSSSRRSPLEGGLTPPTRLSWHVPSCTVCSEMVLVAGALRGDYDHVCRRARAACRARLVARSVAGSP